MNMVLVAGLVSCCLVEMSFASQLQEVMSFKKTSKAADLMIVKREIEREVHEYIDKNFLAAGHSGLLIESKKLDKESGHFLQHSLFAADLNMQMSARDSASGDYVCINIRVTHGSDHDEYTLHDIGTLKGEFILYDKNVDVDMFRWGKRFDTFVLLANYAQLCPEKRNDDMRQRVKNHCSTFIEELFSGHKEDLGLVDEVHE